MYTQYLSPTSARTEPVLTFSNKLKMNQINSGLKISPIKVVQFAYERPNLLSDAAVQSAVQSPQAQKITSQRKDEISLKSKEFRSMIKP
jgi:hypothetical protein